MLAVVLALGASLSWGAADFVGGVLTKRVHPSVVLGVSQAAGLVLALAIAIPAGDLPPARAFAFAVGGGVFGLVGLGALYRGLSVGRMGVVAPIAAMSVLVPVIVGLVQGERPGLVRAAGILLAGAGAVLAARHRDPERSRRVAAGVGLATVAALSFGAVLLCLDAAGNAGASGPWAAVGLRASSVPLAFLTAAVLRSSFVMSRGDLTSLVVIGVLDNLANVAFVMATTKGLLSLVSAVAALVPVATVILAWVVLHERLQRMQVLGVAAAVTGVALIAAG